MAYQTNLGVKMLHFFIPINLHRSSELFLEFKFVHTKKRRES